MIGSSCSKSFHIVERIVGDKQCLNSHASCYPMSPTHGVMKTVKHERSRWQVRKVCDPSIRQGEAEIPLEAFGRMLRRFTTLATPDALELVDEVAGHLQSKES